MGQKDTSRISHDIEDLPTTSRNTKLEQVINDLCEEDSGKGFTEVAYVGSTPFVDKITTWDSIAKNKKRTEVLFTYSPSPFIMQITKNFYNEWDGTTIVAVTIAIVTYNTNKTVKDIQITNTRP